MSTPRYILTTSLVSDAPKYEFPVQALTRNKPTATLVVESQQGFAFALLNALAWTEGYSKTQHLRVFPQVRYGAKRKPSMVTKVVGAHAYIENKSRGSWVPLASLSL